MLSKEDIIRESGDLVRQFHVAGFESLDRGKFLQGLSMQAAEAVYRTTMAFDARGQTKTAHYTCTVQQTGDSMCLASYEAEVENRKVRVTLRPDTPHNITAEGAFHLLEGRAVLLPNGAINYWYQSMGPVSKEGRLTYDIFRNDLHGFNLPVALQPIKDHGIFIATNITDMASDLQKGRAIKAHNIDRSQIYYLEANLKQQKFNVYANGQLITLDSIQHEQSTRQNHGLKV